MTKRVRLTTFGTISITLHSLGLILATYHAYLSFFLFTRAETGTGTKAGFVTIEALIYAIIHAAFGALAITASSFGIYPSRRSRMFSLGLLLAAQLFILLAFILDIIGVVYYTEVYGVLGARLFIVHIVTIVYIAMLFLYGAIYGAVLILATYK